jgi:hypothetical protein
MTILGIIALILVVVLGIAVLRMKNDPLESKTLREDLAEFKRSQEPRTGIPTNVDPPIPSARHDRQN